MYHKSHFEATTDDTQNTLMETAKANNLRLEDYIEHLLTVLPERFANDPDTDIDDLLPWTDGMQKMFTMFGTGT